LDISADFLHHPFSLHFSHQEYHVQLMNLRPMQKYRRKVKRIGDRIEKKGGFSA
jgi:hypothetical protein